MGFRTGAFCKVWRVEPVSDTKTRLRVSINRKNRNGEYEQDFSGFITAVGSAAASHAAKLKEGDRIKLGDVDVTTFYSKEKEREYTTFKVFSFEDMDVSGKSSSKKPAVDEGDAEPDEDSGLPF